MDINQEILKKLNQSADFAKDLRKFFHENPELSLQEFETMKKIKEIAKDLDVECIDVKDGGLILVLHGKNRGKTVAIRADMDALPVLECSTNLKSNRPYISKNIGVSHACGHDSHMAMALGSLDLLVSLRENFDGTVLFAFEQGEECSSNYLNIIKELKNHKPESVLAIHVYSELESNRLSVCSGNRMSAIRSFEVTVHGKGGHASRPDLAINPLMCATQMISNLSNIWTNEIDPTKSVTMTVSTMKCGDTYNVIADDANFAGCIRFFDVFEGEKALNSMKRVCEALAVAHNCTIEFNTKISQPTPVINSEIPSKRAENGIIQLLGNDILIDCEPWFASETFGSYINEFSGALAFLGIKDVENGYGSGHHTTKFDLNPEILRTGIALQVKYVLDSLK